MFPVSCSRASVLQKCVVGEEYWKHFWIYAKRKLKGKRKVEDGPVCRRKVDTKECDKRMRDGVARKSQKTIINHGG